MVVIQTENSGAQQAASKSWKFMIDQVVYAGFCRFPADRDTGCRTSNNNDKKLLILPIIYEIIN
jgi:hypothetical protein